MTSITTRAGKGSPLTHNEVDANFTNLNNDKLDTAGIALGSAASPTLKFTGDTNTGIYSPGADQLAVATNGAGRLFVDASGSVGIGTSSPGVKLHIADGQIRVANSGAINPSLVFTGSSAGASGFQIGQRYNAQELFIYDLAALADRVVVDSAGRVGIGTASPAAALHAVSASAGANSARFSDGVNSTLLIGHAATNLAYLDAFNNLGFYISGTERARIDSSGNVGIGVSSPGAKLDLAAGTGASVTAVLIRSAAANANGFQIVTDSTTDNVYLNNFYNAALRFGTNNTERLRIDSSGRLLVGTSSARSNLVGITPGFQVEGLSNNSNRYAGFIYTSADQGGPEIHFAKSRGTSIGSNVVTQINDEVGKINFEGSDGTNFIRAALIEAFVDGTPGANDMPGRLVFSVTADGAASPTEALRISNDRSITVSDGGNVVLGTTTGTKIGTGTTQKLGFYNATPVVQPTAVADATDAATVITQLNALLTRMRNLGLIAT